MECNRLDTQPYQCDYFLIARLDGNKISKNSYFLTEEQFFEIVNEFQEEVADKRTQTNYKLR